jgi:hypothetical protein
MGPAFRPTGLGMIFTPGVSPDRARDDGSSARDDDDGWMKNGWMKKWVHMMTNGWMKKCTRGGWVPYADGWMKKGKKEVDL